MRLQEQLHPATFKNVPFLVTSANTAGGRKTITHEFVNSNERNVEDLGLLQKTFSMTAVLTGDNYLQKRDSLIRVLDEAGIGELIHPFYGRLQVVSKPYSIVENMAELGEARINLVFERSEENPAPLVGSATVQTISDKVNIFFDKIESDVKEFFSVSNLFPRNTVDAANKLIEVGNAFETATSRVRNNVLGLNQFKKSIIQFEDNIFDFITEPAELADALGDLFTAMRGVATTPIEYLEVLADLYGFGDNDSDLLLTTSEREERQRNRTLINNVMQDGSLAESYLFVTGVVFDTVDDIDEAQTLLDDQYNATVDNLPTDTQVILGDLRNEVRTFLDAQRISAKRVITIETKRIPSQVFTYSLYGSIDNNEKIIELNNITDVSFVEGSVEVLT